MSVTTRDFQSGDEPPLRVALFTGNYNHIPDGVSRTLNRVVGFLERRGIPVLVFGPTVEAPPMHHAGELVPIPSMPAPGRGEYRLTMRFPREARKRLADFGPTLVHVATPDLLGYRALRWARANRVPVVATYHTHFTSYLQYYGLQWMEGVLWSYARHFYGFCEEVYVPSDSMADVLRRHGVGRRLRIWERGVDTERFHPRHRDQAWRRGLGIADDELAVSFVSRLVWEKGLDVYARVVRRLHDEGLPTRALVVGDGPARDALIERLPADAVLTGHLDGDLLARAYAVSDVFLFPSETETFGNVTLEAMASGLPVVCARATGSTQLVVEGETGFLATPGRGDEFFEYTRGLVTDREQRQRLGDAGRRAAERRDWMAVLEQLLGYYRGVLVRTDGAEKLVAQ